MSPATMVDQNLREGKISNFTIIAWKGTWRKIVHIWRMKKDCSYMKNEEKNSKESISQGCVANSNSLKDKDMFG